MAIIFRADDIDIPQLKAGDIITITAIRGSGLDLGEIRTYVYGSFILHVWLVPPN